ncbi:MAG: sigma-54-dependent Fis family transcriptional regulator [Nitrospiraceae bacterium]|nr:MAG: sigma-54-dependent Fis family transcriptional regulator [Nitrospiraceae bacterium]
MAKGNILVVDDDSNLLEVIKMRLESVKYDVVTARNEEESINLIKEHEIDLSVIDLQLEKTDGISVMEHLHRINPDVPVVILTAYGTIESAVEAMRRGAYSYLTKPFDHRELLLQIDQAMEKRKLALEVKRLQGLIAEKYDFSNIIARSYKMQRVLAQVVIIARTDSTVFIHGESGTGKELIAKAIHLESGRKDGPFVAINCAAIPENLLESELFGYEKGAFSGAVQSTKGLFTQAHGGTLFLDEIGDMPLSLQSKILRVLQDRQVCPLGCKKPVEVDVRIIVATNKDLQKEVENKNFRQDLFYRIHVIPVSLPPLREKKDDIPFLVEHFLEKFSRIMNKKVSGITSQALQNLMLHDWPGNVRELENTIEFAMAMTQTNIISDDLVLQTSIPAQDKLKPFKEAKSDFEKEYLSNILHLTQGNVSKASDLAGKYRADFYQLLKKYDLKPEEYKR